MYRNSQTMTSCISTFSSPRGPVLETKAQSQVHSAMRSTCMLTGGSATTWKSIPTPACQNKVFMMPIGSTARALRVAARSAQPTLAKSSERSSLTSRPEGLVAGASPNIATVAYEGRPWYLCRLCPDLT